MEDFENNNNGDPFAGGGKPSGQNSSGSPPAQSNTPNASSPHFFSPSNTPVSPGTASGNSAPHATYSNYSPYGPDPFRKPLTPTSPPVLPKTTATPSPPQTAPSNPSRPAPPPQSANQTQIPPKPNLQTRLLRAKSPIALKTVGIAVLVLSLLGGAGMIWLQRDNQLNRSTNPEIVATQYDTLNLPLSRFVEQGAITVSGNQTLKINGQLQANNSLVISPTGRPASATAGQIYFDQTTNQLAYFNGSQFIPLGSQANVVNSVGGASGAVNVGEGIALVGGALANTGVLSVQGQTGAVTFSAGDGIAINGQVISSTGVTGLGGQTGNVTVGTGLTANGGTLSNAGVLNIIAGTPNLIASSDGAGNITISSVGGGSGTITSTGGTAGRIAKFTTSQNIEDSLLSEVAGTVTTNGNLQVTGSLSLAAALSVVNGGTGATTLAVNGVVIGQGTSAATTATAGSAGLCLMSTAGAPAFSACPGGAGVTSLNGATGVLNIANATEAGGVITINNASTSQKGIAQFNATNFTVSSGVANTIQNIDPTANVTFAGINTSTITPNSTPLTVGSTTQDLTLQGSNILITRTSGANTTALGFASPTANVTYRLQTAAAGTYDVCTTVGNCVGVGGTVSTPGGTTNRLAKFTGSQIVGDSLISDNGTLVTVNGNLSVTGTVTLTTPLPIASGGTGAVSAAAARSNLGAAASGANSDITSLSGLTTALSVVQGGTGASSLTANGILLGNGTSPVSSLAAGGSGLCLVSTAGAPAWQSCPGGGGVSSLNGLTGALTIANASTAGSTVTIDDASTSTKGIASFNSTNFTVTSGAVNTVQNIDIAATPTFGRLSLSSSQASSPMLLANNTNSSATGNLIDLQLGGSSRMAVTPAGNMTLSGSINGQTISSSASFTGTVAVAGTLTANTISPTGAMTIGSAGQSLTLQGAATAVTSTNAGNTTTLNFQTPTANVTYRLQTATAGTYDVCTTVGNCSGVGGGVTTSGGTTNRLAKFTGSQAIGDSIITDNGSTVSIGGNLAVNTITPSAAMTVGATAQNLTLQGAVTSLTSTDSGVTNTLTFATPTSSNKTITIPNASGTVAVSASGPLQLDAAGNVTCPSCVTSGGGGGGVGAVDSLNGLTGALTINNAVGSGSAITINDASTSQKGIAQFNNTNFSASSGTINTVQDINTTAAPTFGRLTVTSSQATNDMLAVNNTNASGTGSLLKLQLNGSNRFTVDPAGNVVANGTISSGTINGQTISSAANFTGSVAVAGTLNVNTITPTGALTAGSTGQNLTLQGATTTVTSTSGGTTTSLTFQAPTANVTYRLLTAAAGTYDLCTTAGNCAGVGGGVTTGGGTTNALAKFTGAQTIGDSNISDNGSTVTIGVNLAVNTITPTSAMTIGATGQNLTLQGATVALSATNGGITNTLTFATPASSNKTITVPNASGTVAVSASGPLAIDAAGNITCATCATGTTVSSLNGQTGAVTLANASGSGGTVTINDASTSTKGIASFNSTNFTASSGAVNTVQDINTTAAPTFGRLTVTSNQATNDMLTINNTNAGATGSLLKVQLNSADRFTVDVAGNVVAAGTITSGNINGQTISSAANFTGSVAVGTTLSVNTITPSAAMTVGATNQNLALQGATTTLKANDSGNSTTLSFQTPTANVTYRLLTTSAGTYDICTTAGNCTGVGGGVTTSGGTTNRLAKFTGAQTIGDSLISDNGTTVTIAGGLSLATGNTYQINGVQISSANLSNDSNLAKLNGTQTFTGATNFFQNASDSTNAFAIQNSLGRNILQVNTTGGIVTLGNVTSTSGQGVAGVLRLADGTNDNFGATLNTTTLTANRTISLPDEAGTVCLQSSASCGFALSSGSGNYIQNGTTVQSANMFIQASNTSFPTAVFEQAASGTADVINILKNDGTTKYLSVSSAGNFSITGGSTYSLSSSGSGSITSNGAITLTAGGSSTWSTSSGALTLTAATNMTLNATGTLSLGSSNTSTLNIGSASNNARTINIGTAGTSQAQTIAIGSGGTSTSTTAIQGGTGTNAVTLAAAAGGSISSTVTGAGNINFNTDAGVFAKATTDSTSTFQVQNTATRGVLTVDTSNSRTILGNITSTSGQGVAGTLLFADGTNDNFGLTLNTTTLSANRTITLPDEAGTVCLRNSTNCGFAASSGSTSYIQNQNSSDQTADFRISGTGRMNTSLLTPLIDTASAAALNIGTTNATVINLNQNAALASGKTLSLLGGFIMQPASDSTSIFNLKTSAGNNMFTIDTTNGRVGISLGANALPNSTLEVGGTILLSGSAFESFNTPVGSNVNTKINIPKQDPGSFGQIIALGVTSGAQSTSRILSLFDARTSAHRPSLSVFSPDESKEAGLSWEGSNAISYLKSTAGDWAIRSDTTDIALFESGGDVGIGTSNATARLHVSTSAAETLFQVTDATATALDVLTIADEGATVFRNRTDSTTAFRVSTADGSTPVLTVSTSGNRVGITNSGTQGALDVTGIVKITGTSTESYTTPLGSNIGAKMYFTNQALASATQLIAGGLTSGANATARGIVIFDARTVAHQQSIGVFSPDENDIVGLSWEGSNTTSYLKTLSGNLAIRSNTTDIMTFLAGGNVGVGASPSYKFDVAGDINTSTVLRIAGTTICSSSGCTPAAGSVNYIQNTTTVQTNANMAIQSAADGSVTLLVKNRAAQSADTFRIVDSNDTLVFHVDTFGSGSISNQFAVGTYLGVGTSASSGTQLRVAVADANTTAISVVGNSSQAVDLMNFDAAGNRTLKYTADGTFVVGADSGQSANLFELQSSAAAAMVSVSKTGAATFKNSSDSTTAFVIKNSSDVAQLTIDTTNSRVYVGATSGDTTGALLVLDTKTSAGDPTGVDGAMYYNSSIGVMRCYADGSWQHCGGPVRMKLGYNLQEDFMGDGSSSSLTLFCNNATQVSATHAWSCDGSGTGSGALQSTVDEYRRPGQIQLTTGTTSTGYTSIFMGSGGVPPFMIGGGETFETAINIPTLSTGGQTYIMRLGLCDANTHLSDCGNGVYFEYDAATSTNWRYATAANSGTRTKNSSSKAVATGWTNLKWVANSSTSITFYVKSAGETSYTNIGTTTTNVPNNTASLTDLLYFIDKTAGTTARTFKIDYVDYWNDVTTAR